MNTVEFSFYFSAIMMIQISSPTAEKFHQKGIKCKVYSQQKTKKKAHSWEKKKKKNVGDLFNRTCQRHRISNAKKYFTVQFCRVAMPHL